MSDLPTELAAELGLLRGRLSFALCCASLVLATPIGCTDGTASGTTKPANQHATTWEADSAGDSYTPPPLDCSSGQWCGRRALVEPLRRTFRQGGRRAPNFEGCPGTIDGIDGIELEDEQRSRYGSLPMTSDMTATVDPEATAARRSEGQPDACCYDWMTRCPGGRPLLDRGAPQLAPLRPGSRWTAELPSIDRNTIARLSPRQRESIAAAWLDDARIEHSSIASFRRARAELVAVDAPAALLRGCERAAVDERRHARICFGLAAAYGQRSLEPERLPVLGPREGGLVRVAIDTFVEGCVGETVATACVRRAASEARDPALAHLLARIAADEANHAALAWQTVAWAIDRGGPSVVAAVRAIAVKLRPDASAPGGDREIEPGHGRLTLASQARVRRATWATIIDPLLTRL